MPRNSRQPATLAQMAALLRITEFEIKQLERKAGLPTLGRNKYDLVHVVHWWLDRQKQQLEAEMARRTIWTHAEVAYALKVEQRTVNNLVNKDGMPKEARGQYDIVKVFRWIVDRFQKQLMEARQGGESMADAKSRKIQIEANLKAIDLAKARREVMAIEDVKQLLQGPIKVTTLAMRSLPDKLTPPIVQLTGCQQPDQLKSMLILEIESALNEFADIPNRLSGPQALPERDHSGTVEGIQTAGTPHRKRVGGSVPPAKSRKLRRSRTVAH